MTINTTKCFWVQGLLLLALDLLELVSLTSFRAAWSTRLLAWPPPRKTGGQKTCSRNGGRWQWTPKAMSPSIRVGQEVTERQEKSVYLCFCFCHHKKEFNSFYLDFTFLIALGVKSKVRQIGANNIILTFIYFNNDFRFLYRILINF